MRCEVCGRKIHSDPVTAIIEGAKLTVCVECSKHGKVIYEVADFPACRKPPPQHPRIQPHLQPNHNAHTNSPEKTARRPSANNQEVIEDYAAKIRVAREKLGLTHEDLGKKINEKASLLRHIETGKVAPNNQLANKLEHVLKIKLMVPIADEKATAHFTE